MRVLGWLRGGVFFSLILVVAGCVFMERGTKLPDDDPRLKDAEHDPPVIPEFIGKYLTIKKNTYEIRGRSVVELNEEMQKKSPCKATVFHHDSEKSIACTQSRFTLALNDANPSQVQGLCRSESFRLQLRITITLPQWSNTSDGDYGVLNAWDFFHKALTRHEDGHAYIAIRELIDFEQAVDDAFSERPENDCEDRRQIFSKLWQQAFEKVKKRNQDYDQRTANGINNGTSFY
ncbi:MAG: hypothetical protein HW380_1668 [Magnetococcales bacterium]|nr:hypothetical protein [Magnetococcales bacterium]HIJ82661.1 DUF922 domain-containing protein [Magnetococcales bacterium]